jgi:hypothetical protein
MNKLKKLILKWLGVEELQSSICETSVSVTRLHNKLAEIEANHTGLRTAFNEQMKMVGFDVHLHKGVQTQIIFVSRLGNNGGGTVKIVDTSFENISQLTNFIELCEQQFSERVVIDAHPSFLKALQNDRSHGWGRW